LANALKDSTILTSLGVAQNKIDARGAKALADALKVNATLTSLNLRGNGIGVNGAVALADALKVNATLTGLTVRGNDIGDEGAVSLAAALEVNKVLAVLNVRDNVIGDEGAVALAAALKVNKVITGLNVRGNAIDDKGTVALASAFKVNKFLTSLNVEGNPIGAKGADALIHALKDNNTLTSLVVDGAGGIEVKQVGSINNLIDRNRVLKDHSIALNYHSERFYIKIIHNYHEGEARTDISWSTGLWKREVAYIGVGDEYVEKHWQFNDRPGGESEEALSTQALTKETCPIWEVATGDGMLCKFTLDAFKQVLEKTLAPERAIKDLVDNNKNKDGVTLLQLAAGLDSKEALDLCKFLVEDVGVDFDTIADNKRRTVRDIALGNGNDSINAWARTVGTIFGRYRIKGGPTAPPIHKSATCIVHFAVDMSSKGDTHRHVALKIMNEAVQMDRELKIRFGGSVSVAEGVDVLDMSNKFDVDHAVPLLRYHKKVLVMPRGERSLHQIIDSERIAGKDLDNIYAYGKDMAMALEHLHSGHRIVHGDFKPRNVVRINGHLKLIDFDASVTDGEELTEKCSSGYIPPELARSKFVIKDTEEELNQQIVGNQKQLEEAFKPGAEVAEMPRLFANFTTLRQKLESLQRGEVISNTAEESMDIWAFGATMYYLCSGQTLFSCDLNDNIVEEAELMRLKN
jgi:hypothetical protein